LKVFISLWSTILAWTPVPPTYPLDSCPQSVQHYDCEAAKEIWNAPYLAEAGQEKNEPLCVIHLPGTNGMASQSLDGQLSSYAAVGHFVLGLSYVMTPFPVGIINQLCGDMSLNGQVDTGECWDNFHSTVLFANGSSTIWSIPNNQSVMSRALDAFTQLHDSAPGVGWDSFLSADSSSVRWDRIIVVGFSQGAGHAAYLAYHTRVKRAILLSGPENCCTRNSFLTRPFMTPRADIGAFFHHTEDTRGPIEDALTLMNLTEKVEYIPGQLASLSSSSTRWTEGKVFYTEVPPSDVCFEVGGRITDRSRHFSMDKDMCSPRSDETTTGYLYEAMWQYLAQDQPANDVPETSSVCDNTQLIIALVATSVVVP
jgi:hypothetical protein